MSPFFVKATDSNGIDAQSARAAVRTLLRYMGEDPDRDGLLETPDRVCRAWLEMTEGYRVSPEQVLSTTFEGNSDEMVVLKDIEFTSCCEHHLLNFNGRAHVAYLPSQGRIVGLSKLARIVDVFAKRLQVQERMTQQIASAVKENLQPHGVAVVIEGRHSCMCVRGVRKQGATMVTSSLHGVFRDNASTRAEFMSLIGIGRRD
ncbi:MAG: cyclohydrolase FolE [Pseudomonadota bacterium]|jgi:GTP cyclohydrolase I